MEVLQILRSTATSNTSSPNRIIGWGIINALTAINSVTVPVELTLFNGIYEDECC